MGRFRESASLGADVVVLGAVGMRVLHRGEQVVDLFEEESFVLQGAEAAFAGAVLPWGADPGAGVSQLGVGGDEVFEPQRPERSAVVGHDRDRGGHLPGLVPSADLDPWPAEQVRRT